jgi:hypothetical protein
MLAFRHWKLNSTLLGQLLMPPLSNANKEHLQQEQAMAERLNQMSAAARGTYYNFLAFFQFPCPSFAC